MKILYDPVYNFHQGYHKQIISCLVERYTLVKGKIINLFEDEIREQFLGGVNNIVNIGYFISDEQFDLIFSPHILVLNQTPWIIEIEDICWLFTDKYGETNLNEIPQWKAGLAITYLRSDLCVGILAWSNHARETIGEFMHTYGSSLDFQAVMRKVFIVYPYIEKIGDTNILKSQKRVRILFSTQKSTKAELFRKGWDILGKLFSKDLESIADRVELVIVGVDAEIVDEIRESIKCIIERHPRLEHSQFTSVMTSCDVLLFPSRADTFGTIITEALAAGLIPVCSSGKNVPVPSEIVVNGQNGEVVIASSSNRFYDVPDSYRLAETILHVVKELPKYKMSLNQWEASNMPGRENFSRERMNTQLSKLIN